MWKLLCNVKLLKQMVARTWIKIKYKFNQLMKFSSANLNDAIKCSKEQVQKRKKKCHNNANYLQQ